MPLMNGSKVAASSSLKSLELQETTLLSCKALTSSITVILHLVASASETDEESRIRVPTRPPHASRIDSLACSLRLFPGR